MKYTVVGYWWSSDVPWVECVDAPSVRAAPALAVKALLAEDEDADAAEAIVVEAFEGEHSAQLYNQFIASVNDLKY